MYNELPIWGNIDIFIDNKAYIYTKFIMINQ